MTVTVQDKEDLVRKLFKIVHRTGSIDKHKKDSIENFSLQFYKMLAYHLLTTKSINFLHKKILISGTYKW